MISMMGFLYADDNDNECWIHNNNKKKKLFFKKDNTYLPSYLGKPPILLFSEIDAIDFNTRFFGNATGRLGALWIFRYLW